MTNKEYRNFWYTIKFFAIAFLGFIMGGFITSLRYDSEIRNDQVELKEDVAEVTKDKTVIDDLTKQLIFHIEQLELERERLRDLQLKLSKGEKIKCLIH
ncbi:MAG: hypothetical protein JRI26_13335 [Deltaproteobacteria bacterium]|nr:hypothetical protein [Deltaproteobacteria bacterium]